MPYDQTRFWSQRMKAVRSDSILVTEDEGRAIRFAFGHKECRPPDMSPFATVASVGTR
jgi:hypothetical protein